ncbi:TetR family transcriptional regulator [Kribbella kalugense]|uniref:TetR family transcriptional regulator n=2 Tax=Kribbella kalugense TaxID=2512221 RepID=A0A4R8A1A2_9ACTN|nr:TetR family transcriptional regulator [Kribbella kalugense]
MISHMGRTTRPAAGPRRVRDPTVHQAEILAAARDCFSEFGYARATIREIARRAGVTHGLVIRHFSTKEDLFVASMPGLRDLDDIVIGDPTTLPERVAAAFVERMDAAAAADPIVALIRSAATNEKVAVALYQSMQHRSSVAFRRVVKGRDADNRIDMLNAILIGVTFNRYVVRVGPVASMPPKRLVAQLARELRHILFD